MKTDYYEHYWNAEDNHAAGWTPSQGIITVDERRFFDRYLPAGSVCVDYGCGDGLRYGKSLQAKGVDYHGFDVSESALRQAQSRGLNVQKLGDNGLTTMQDASADVAICFEVLEHLIEPQSAVAELKRCLKPGGHAIISVPNAAFWTARLEFLLTGFWCPGGSPITGRATPWCDPHIRFYHPPMLHRLMTTSGLDVVEQRGEAFTLGALPYIWKRPALKRAFDWLSSPLGWLGRVLPGLFAPRLFIVIRKPLA